MRIISKKMKQAGQGMTEYIIIVALIAVAAIAVTQLFGGTVRNQMAAIAKEVSGNSGDTAIQAAGSAATNAAAKAKTNQTLSTFGDQATDGAQSGGQ